VNSSTTPTNITYITIDELIEALGGLVYRDNQEVYVGIYDGYDARDILEFATKTINIILNKRSQENKE
jgi:hypothetical protein